MGPKIRYTEVGHAFVRVHSLVSTRRKQHSVDASVMRLRLGRASSGYRSLTRYVMLMQAFSLQSGLRAIVDCRTALAYSYVEAYFCESASAALLFTHAQSQLEEFTDILQVRILYS